ncbi:leucine-rich repeat protein [Perkinsela sp. CCAP 1560/4]|nr:leucine-rich repeat protein [Perkinsela sp. CCAP 1560/4]|eukprot:KNH08471.1 leucine-rich repeat protein [Perkinsela sp. CCAP 1560/4]
MRMEHLISGFNSLEHFEPTATCLQKFFCFRLEEFYRVCDWFEVRCDDENNVESVSWAKRTPLHDFQGGSIRLSWIPPNVAEFDIRWQGLSGSISTESLSHSLVTLLLGGNRFHGTIDLCTLPPKLELFSIPGNEIEGPIDLTSLPSGLATLNLHKNKIYQEIVDLSYIPESTTRILLTRNSIGKLVDADGDVETHECVKIDPPRESIFSGYL